jgi:YfiR/HmsC-like
VRTAGSRGLLGVVVVLLAFGSDGRVARADDPATLELAVKATFLYKFQPFVTWPEGAFAAPGSPFNLCIVGGHPFGDLLDRAVAGQQTQGHPIAVLRLPLLTADAHCQMIYIASTDARAAQELEAAIAGQPILTVTDNITDDTARGMIDFVIVDNKVRFAIDNAAAVKAGLSISSKLLSLAVSVKAAP